MILFKNLDFMLQRTCSTLKRDGLIGHGVNCGNVAHESIGLENYHIKHGDSLKIEIQNQIEGLQVFD